ncbi:MAG: hypothetical protein DRJ03_26715, partial [Chloroflexi bacterium]
MRTKLTSPILVLLIVTLLVTFFVKPINAPTITITKTVVITGHVYDGTLYGNSTSYATAHDAASGTFYDEIQVGQQIWSGQYWVYRGFLYFDTTSIPDNATIDEAKISIEIEDDLSDTDFNITIQNGQPTYPSTPLTETDYNKNYYSGNGGQLDTSTIGLPGRYNITLTETGWINKQGMTKLCLRSDRDINDETPTGDEFVIIFHSESSSPPKIYITYTVSGDRYIFFGPYYEDGTACSTPVTVHIYSETQNPYTFTLDGDTETIDWVEPVT